MKNFIPFLFIFNLIGCASTPPAGQGLSLQKNEALPPASFQNQHGKTISWDASTRWILFSKEKEVNARIHSVLQPMTPAAQSHVFYVADISGMPSLISKLFALPKMRKYSYSVALEREGTLTASWPTQQDHITVFKVENQKIKEILFVKTSEELQRLLNLKEL